MFMQSLEVGYYSGFSSNVHQSQIGNALKKCLAELLLGNHKEQPKSTVKAWMVHLPTLDAQEARQHG